MASRKLITTCALALILSAGAIGYSLLGGTSNPIKNLPQSLTQPAKAQTNVTINNLKIVTDYVTYTVPRLEVVGANMSEVEIRAMFDASQTASLFERLSKFSAQEVRFPEMIMDQKIGKTGQVTTYGETVIKNITNGKIATSVSNSGKFISKEADGKTLNGTMGKISADEVDLASIIQLYTGAQSASGAVGELKKLYGRYEVLNSVFEGSNGEKFTIARVSGADFKARLGSMSWTQALKEFSNAEDFDNLSPERKKSLTTALYDFFNNIDMGWFEVADMRIIVPNETSKPDVTIARIAYGSPDTVNTSARELRIEGTSVVAANTRVRIAVISSKGFSAKTTFDAFKDAIMKDDFKFEKINPRSLVPTLGTLRFEGMDFDVPDVSAKGTATAQDKAKPNIKFTLKNTEIAADKVINGIPTRIVYAMNGFNMTLPENTSDASLKALLDLGYKQVDISFGLSMNWDEKTNEVTMSDLSYRGEKMGVFSSKLKVGNVTQDAFNLDTAVATVALMGATAKTLDINIENTGIVDKIIEQEAKKSKKTSEDMRREYAAIAAVAIPSVLGNSENAQKIAQAVAKFIAKPVKLTINAKAKKPEGLGLLDVISDLTPQAVLEKLDVTAVAQ